jgi:hypothetical protein
MRGRSGRSGRIGSEPRFAVRRNALAAAVRLQRLDQDGAEVVDVGERRAGHHLVAEAAKKPWPSWAAHARS